MMGDASPPAKGPFARALDPDFASLPCALRLFHGVQNFQRFSGEADITVAPGWLRHAVLRVGGFPRHSGRVPLVVTVEVQGGREIWRRDFGGTATVSELTLQRGRVVEAFGPVTFELDLSVKNHSILIGVRRAWLFRVIPLPWFLIPASDSVEWADDQGRFRFDIKVDFPGLGRLIEYRGHIV